MTSQFQRYEFRTTDVNAAEAFYSDVLGSNLWGPDISISQLPERARARGAPPHWLGHVGVGDVEGTLQRFVTAGAEPLGPTLRGADGSSRAILRDPFGAVLGLQPETAAPRRDRVAWHVLHTRDHLAAFGLYSSLFGWTPQELVDRGPDDGLYLPFVWDDSGRNRGSVSNAARLPHVHPQWLYFFRVPDLEASLAKVRARGGITLEPTRTSSGDLVAGCDDAQGAAFALYQSHTVRGR